MKEKRKSNMYEEYLYYLMNDVGLLNDYQLNEIGISFDEYENPDEYVLEKIEDYRNKIK